jgi:hypothetical protein
MEVKISLLLKGCIPLLYKGGPTALPYIACFRQLALRFFNSV